MLQSSRIQLKKGEYRNYIFLFQSHNKQCWLASKNITVLTGVQKWERNSSLHFLGYPSDYETSFLYWYYNLIFCSRLPIYETLCKKDASNCKLLQESGNNFRLLLLSYPLLIKLIIILSCQQLSDSPAFEIKV